MSKETAEKLIQTLENMIDDLCNIRDNCCTKTIKESYEISYQIFKLNNAITDLKKYLLKF